MSGRRGSGRLHVFAVLASTALLGVAYTSSFASLEARFAPGARDAEPLAYAFAGEPHVLGRGSEPEIVVSSDGRNLLVAAIDGLDGLGTLFHSGDGGLTWTELLVPFPVRVDGPALALAPDGSAYYAGTSGPSLHLGVVDIASGEWRLANAVASASHFVDRPWVAVGADGRVFVLHNDLFPAWEHCSSSTDGGVTFLDKWPSHPALAGRPSVTADGTLHYVRGGFSAGSGAAVGTLFSIEETCIGERSQRTILYDIGTAFFVATAADGDSLFLAAPVADEPQARVVRVLDGVLEEKVLRFASAGQSALLTMDAQGGRVAMFWMETDEAGDPTEAAFGGAWWPTAAVIDDWSSLAATASCGDPGVRCARLSDTPTHVGDICRNSCGDPDADGDLLHYMGARLDATGRLHVAYTNDHDYAQRSIVYQSWPGVAAP